MVKDSNFIKESASIIEEIESQLQDVLDKRKKEVESELEEKIRREQEEAKKRISDLESQLKGDKETLVNYKNVLTDFEANKERLKREIKTHLDKAIQLQTEIEEKIGVSLQELRTVDKLNKELEGINQEAVAKVNALKTDLEDKYGIIAKVPDTQAAVDVDFDLDRELRKLQKIKELISGAEAAERPHEEIEAEEEPEKAEEEAGETETEARDQESEVKEEEPEDRISEAGTVEPPAGEEEEKKEEPGKTHEEDLKNQEKAAGTEESDTSPASAEEGTGETAGKPKGFSLSPELESYQGDEAVRKAFESLNPYRRSESIEGGGEVVYYEKDGKIILEGENLVAAISRSLDEARELYGKLADTDSPKEQFFIKQDIIRRQDSLRKVMLGNIRWSEKEACSLPESTRDSLNSEVLKSILEKVSMENWSNKDDFTSFSEYIRNLKDGYYKVLSPPDKYFESICGELEKG